MFVNHTAATPPAPGRTAAPVLQTTTSPWGVHWQSSGSSRSLSPIFVSHTDTKCPNFAANLTHYDGLTNLRRLPTSK